MSPGSVNSLFFSTASLLAGSVDSPLANSPHLPSSQAFQLLHRPASLAEKARINAGYVLAFDLLCWLGVEQPEANCDWQGREIQRNPNRISTQQHNGWQ